MRLLVALIVLLTAVAAAAQPAAPTLTVFAASDLALVFQEIAPRFEKVTGAKVTLVLGSSGNFTQQIENGAPADVFFSADVGFVDRLVQRGLIIPETRAIYGQGRIVLATARSTGPRLTDLRQLAEPRVRHVSIANPVHAPYGRAAEQALRAVGMWESVKPKRFMIGRPSPPLINCTRAVPSSGRPLRRSTPAAWLSGVWSAGSTAVHSISGTLAMASATMPASTAPVCTYCSAWRMFSAYTSFGFTDSHIPTARRASRPLARMARGRDWRC